MNASIFFFFSIPLFNSVNCFMLVSTLHTVLPAGFVCKLPFFFQRRITIANGLPPPGPLESWSQREPLILPYFPIASYPHNRRGDAHMPRSNRIGKGISLRYTNPVPRHCSFRRFFANIPSGPAFPSLPRRSSMF